MTHLLEKDTPFIFSKECIEAFETLKKKLTEVPILIALDWDLPFEIICDASDFAVGAENLAANHLSRLENPHQGDLEKKEINETFPLKTLEMISFHGDSISKSGNPTPSLDPIIMTSSPSLTPFEGGDFILEEIEACLSNGSIPPRIDDADFDPEGDIRLLKKLLNDDPSSPLPSKELNFEELKTIKSSIDDPPELELKDLPSHLEYAFLEGTDKFPIIIS
ncbi:reverse transcriptase domain-containing protein [Tanacetum coccineum]|uniref:Reverse transcriptase domain-containing protein n=1 Tax=Tanacetum coccineum TaxID=301880 RepID=A0ABQ5I3E9_9ASTR